MNNRRLDPEQPAPLKHIWRPLQALSGCSEQARSGWASSKSEWYDDVNYCLDRYLTYEPQ